ncbi:hypothetical protein B4589_011680 [Halolamina sp. CBA1230]|uniref:hypothetical protein n=1 Tax=Halolamina sp. CBA1230 TaxID=1853690 RepID=UPI00117B3E86|nr:hypothetical protein [Halolamina sp. CBA1230]QKY21001.1 hypothetical protein B4589_011680 [Halolamina sp. CBA1230]
MSRLPAVAVVIALLALSGCLSGGPTETPSPTPNTDCPYVLSVDPAGEASGDRIEYADLPEQRQGEFDRALADGSVELGETLPEEWSEPRIVEYEGAEYYAVASVC